MTQRPWIDLGLMTSGWITLALVLGAPEPLRAASVFLFTFSCPGLAIVRLARLTNRLERNIVAVGTSLSLAAIVTELLSLAHAFSDISGIVVLSSLTTATALLNVRHSHVANNTVSLERG